MLLATIMATGAVMASDGRPDPDGRFPAVAGYYQFFVYWPAELSCSGALVSEKVVLTASHCTAFNYTEDIGIDGYSSRVWVSFDVAATTNDFRCFLADQDVEYSQFLTGEYACDAAARSEPKQTDILPTPLPMRGVGYGLNWGKTFGARPTAGLGPMTDLDGGSGVKRIAAVEPVISAVLSGGTNWCQGSKDPYYRIDQAEAYEFVQCVIDRQHDVGAACRECSAEHYFELCG